MALEITKVLSNFVKDTDIDFCKEAIEPTRPKPSIKTEAKDACIEIQTAIKKIEGDVETQKAIEQSKADTTNSIMGGISPLTFMNNVLGIFKAAPIKTATMNTVTQSITKEMNKFSSINITGKCSNITKKLLYFLTGA